MKHITHSLLMAVALLSLLFANTVRAAPVKAAPTWQPGTYYAVGAQVTYNGQTYQCIQAHTSLTGWEPATTPALWNLVAGATATQVMPSATVKTPTPTLTKTPTATLPKTATINPTVTPTITNTQTGYCNTPAWVRTQVYNTNDRIFWNQHEWRARWWTQGEEPGTTGQWGVWEDKGVCGGTGTNTPPPFTPTLTSTPITRTPTATSTQVTGSPVSINGQLRVCGNQICNQYNLPIQLRGMSTHGIQWYNQCINTASMNALAYDWKADILRISLYVQEGGYETDPVGFRAKVNTIASLAEARGMYYILDWHMLEPGDPNYNLARAKEYFGLMAQTHGSKPNVLYEIANEPSGVSWAAIKSYAEQVIPVIRQYDPDGIIIVGTRGWSSLGVSEGGSAAEIVANPVSGINLMYTFHFYAASHLDEHRNELAWAADRLPIFVTEWGTQEYTGDGANNFASAQQYLDLMASKKISWTSWNFSDDQRSGAAFIAGTCPNGPFTGTSRLKPAGVWVRDHILNPADHFPIP